MIGVYCINCVDGKLVIEIVIIEEFFQQVVSVSECLLYVSISQLENIIVFFTIRYFQKMCFIPTEQ